MIPSRFWTLDLNSYLQRFHGFAPVLIYDAHDAPGGPHVTQKHGTTMCQILERQVHTCNCTPFFSPRLLLNLDLHTSPPRPLFAELSPPLSFFHHGQQNQHLHRLNNLCGSPKNHLEDHQILSMPASPQLWSTTAIVPSHVQLPHSWRLIVLIANYQLDPHRGLTVTGRCQNYVRNIRYWT